MLSILSLITLRRNSARFYTRILSRVQPGALVIKHCSLTLSPAQLSSVWMLACLLARLPAWWFNYSFLDGCKEFETFTWTVFQNRIAFWYSYRPLVLVLFLYIRTDIQYWYYFLEFVLIPYIGTIFLYSYWYPLSVLLACIVLFDSDIYYAYTQHAIT